MIKVEEAKRLVLSYKKNYRMQERIDLENRVSAEVESVARKGESYYILIVNPKDSDYIQEKLKENGFKCGVVSTAENADHEFVHIKVCWWDE